MPRNKTELINSVKEKLEIARQEYEENMNMLNKTQIQLKQLEIQVYGLQAIIQVLESLLSDKVQ